MKTARLLVAIGVASLSATILEPRLLGEQVRPTAPLTGAAGEIIEEPVVSHNHADLAGQAKRSLEPATNAVGTTERDSGYYSTLGDF